MENAKIFYICDRKKCKKCSYPVCKHTDDIEHAVNFEKSVWARNPFSEKEVSYWEAEK